MLSSKIWKLKEMAAELICASIMTGRGYHQWNRYVPTKGEGVDRGAAWTGPSGGLEEPRDSWGSFSPVMVCMPTKEEAKVRN